MKKRCAEITEWLRKVVWILFAVIIGYLLISSIFSTCYTGALEYITNSGKYEINTEHTFFLRDNWWVHLAVFICISMTLCVKRKKKIYPIKNVLFVSAVLLIILLYIVYGGQYYPKADQRRVVEIAAEFCKQDYSAVEKGGYLYLNPHQLGIILYFMVLSKLFGELNIVAFQVINIFWIIVSFAELVWIGGNLDYRSGGRQRLMTSICVFLFFPWTFYVTYLYGTVIGEALSLGAICCLMLFKKKKRVGYIILGSISIGAAVLLKSNFMIFAIAMILYLINESINENGKIKSILFICFIVTALMVGKTGADAYLENISGGKNIKGVPMLAYVEMGLQDGKTAPGWYNGYNHNVYRENDCNYENTMETIKNDMAETVLLHCKNPMTSISFFVKKVTAQWNNPTFQSLWSIEGREGKNNLQWILEGNGRWFYIFFVNIFQTVIYIGALFFVKLRFRKGKMDETLLLLIFLGGFVFHIIWEAKSMYAMPFFLLLLPISCNGWEEYNYFLKNKLNEIRENGWTFHHKKALMVLLACTTAICIISYTDTFSKIFARKDDTGIFNPYTQDVVNYEKLEMRESQNESKSKR